MSRLPWPIVWLAFAALALLAYWPALGGGFVWDDSDWIRDNEALRSPSGLWRIWFEPGAVIQYYPLTYTSWWLDHLLWDLSPTAMHVENVLLHATNATLFGAVLRRLGLPGASFAALLFLLHPVHAESVAWLVERKNTLSTTFYLLACRRWLVHLERPGAGGLAWGALAWFGLALLAKTATLTLPVTLLAIALWRDRARFRDAVAGHARRLLPFALLSLVFAVVTVVRERGEGAVGADWALTAAERLALLGQNVGFYLGRLALPLPGRLSFVYAKWPIAAAQPLSWLPTVALVAVLLLSVRARRAPAVAASLCLWVYVGNLLPVTGLVDFYYLRYAFAADHFQYLPSLGALAFAGCGAAAALGVRRGRPAWRAAALVVLALLGAHTWRRAATYTDLETLWRATLASEPDAWLAHTNLGNLLAERDGPDAGIEHHRRAVAAYPDAFESNNALGNFHVRRGDYDQARRHFDRALAVRPDDPLTYNNLGAMYGVAGELAEAKRWFERGHERAPHNRDLLRNLATLLAQAPDAALRDGPRALRLARELNAAPSPSLQDEYVLWRALLLAGDRGAAVRSGERVLARARREGQGALADRVVEQLRRLRR